MRKIMGAIARVLDSPFLQRLGAGVFLAGLIGGAMKVLVEDFPLVPLILTMVGGFMLGVTALGTLIGHWLPSPSANAAAAPIDAETALHQQQVEREREHSEEERRQRLRRGAQTVMAELEGHRVLIEKAIEDGRYWNPDERTLLANAWAEWEGVLGEAAEFVRAHAAARGAYIRTNELNHLVQRRARDSYGDSRRNPLVRKEDNLGPLGTRIQGAEAMFEGALEYIGGDY